MGLAPSRVSHKDAVGRLLGLEREAHEVADRLPELLLDAQRIAATVAHGIHGRRRTGPGETFWQFRQLQASDSVHLIDWRRSASSDHLYVREREWEAAHTVWLWPDLSASMDFVSSLSRTTKRDRVLVLTLAIAELLVRGGERVALMGLTPPTASRKATSRMAETIAAHAHSPQLASSLPPKARLSRFSGAILFGDFLDPIEDIRASLDEIAAAGVTGHLVQVLDPAEETLPYEGRTEFLALEGDQRWIADRTESLRPEYQRRLAAHRAALEEMTRHLGWSFMVHHTDRPASEPLLALLMQLHGAAGGSYRWNRGPAPEAGDRT